MLWALLFVLSLRGDAAAQHVSWPAGAGISQYVSHIFGTLLLAIDVAERSISAGELMAVRKRA